MSKPLARLGLASILLMPNAVFAHNAEMLFFPIGTISAAVAAFFISLISGFRLWVHFLAALIAIVVIVPFWFVPMSIFPDWFLTSRVSFFAYGFLPSFALSGAALWWLWRRAGQSI